nr:uncharacterized protein LOC101250290 isoform X2 [Solanum lycopersicum]
MRNPAIPAQVESRRCSSQIASPVQRNRPESVVLAYGTRCRNLPSLSSFASNRMTIFILPLRIVECGGGSSDRVRTRLSLLLRKRLIIFGICAITIGQRTRSLDTARTVLKIK